MGSNGVDLLPRADEAGGSEATIEIKIKTLDSQTYTLRVDKQVPVPALKEQIASVTGVLSDQQRLICRGKVLKDDQLLSAYHVEDGHTLHLVVQQPVLPSSEGLSNHPGINVNLDNTCVRQGVNPIRLFKTQLLGRELATCQRLIHTHYHSQCRCEPSLE